MATELAAATPVLSLVMLKVKRETGRVLTGRSSRARRGEARAEVERARMDAMIEAFILVVGGLVGEIR